jgi:signal transduction histidine kinase
MQRRILITDDDASVRNSLSKAVRRLGYTVFEAESADSALHLLSDSRTPGIDLLIADVVMPQMSGIELLKEVRRLHPDLPVAMISGAATLESSIAALNAGAFAYLLKPIQKDQLRDVIVQGVQRGAEIRAKQLVESKSLDRYQERKHSTMLVQTNHQDSDHIAITRDPLADLILGLRHELGNAITAIKLNLSVLEEGGHYYEPLKDHLRDLQTTTDELAAILSRLKQYPNAPMHLDVVDLRQVLVSLIDMEYGKFERKHIQLDCSIPDRELPVFGVEMELSRAFKHLLDNAVEATEQVSRRQVQIQVVETTDQVAITISDNGAGFPSKALDQIFSPGYTTKISDGVVRGLGLGLFVTQATINLYGGSIWLENRPEGGASIHISLPLAQSLPYPVTATQQHQD